MNLIVSDIVDWTGAACLGRDPEMWFSDIPTESTTKQSRAEIRAIAKSVCSECEIRAKCGDWATRNRIRHGIWGGKTPSERGIRSYA